MFCVRLSESGVLQVIRVIHRLFSIACGVSPGSSAVLQVIQIDEDGKGNDMLYVARCSTSVAPRHWRLNPVCIGCSTCSTCSTSF